MIKVYNLSKKYGSKYVFKNFSYSFDKGAYLIKGKSGIGKTTLLNILAGEDKDYDGSVHVLGNIFYLKDRGNLVSNLTVREHFKLFEIIQNKRIIYCCDIDRLLNKKVKYLSLGELQLVQMNLAFNCSEQILLLDEPFSALSYENIKVMIDIMEKVKKDKLIIFTKHNDYMSDFATKVFMKDNVVDEEVCSNYRNTSKIKIEFKYLLFYFKKVFPQKIFFVFSLVISLFSCFFIDDYLDNNFDKYVEYFKEIEGTLINKKNTVYSLDENLFYEVIKELSPYVVDYNANYYNSLLYEKDLMIDNYYIDNAFVLSSIKYAEENLEADSFIVGINYNKFCFDNLINGCNKDYIDTLLVNKKLLDFPYAVDRVVESEDTVVFSNKRFFKIYDNNDYEEYYFDIKKEDIENVFKKINTSNLLANFEFVLIGENENHQRYRVEIKEYKYFNNIDYSEYIVCLEEGYDCNNYINHFKNLIKIDSFKDIGLLELKVYKEKLDLNEIVISSKLAEILNKGKGDEITLFMKCNESIKKIEMYIKDVVISDECILFQNSEWSYSFFKEIVGLSLSNLRIKDLLIYEDIKEEDYKGNNEYNDLIKEFKSFFVNMKKSIQYISLGLTSVSVIVLIVLEFIQTKFKKEYFNYLRLLNVQIKKEP